MSKRSQSLRPNTDNGFRSHSYANTISRTRSDLTPSNLTQLNSNGIDLTKASNLTKKKIERIMLSFFEENDSCSVRVVFQAHINEMIERQMTRYSQELMNQSNRIHKLEETIIKLRDKHQNLEVLMNTKISSLECEIKGMTTENIAAFDLERQQRLSASKKLLEKCDDKFKAIDEHVRKSNEESFRKIEELRGIVMSHISASEQAIRGPQM